MDRRPNILLIITDQQRFDHLGIKGMRAIGTPHLDRIATEGVHFDRAYTVSPICTPARVSLLTGRYPSQHGAWSIGVSVNQPPGPLLPEVLAQSGYRTALFGKTHFVCRKDEASHLAGDCDKPAPEPDFFRKFSGPYMGFDHVQVSSGHTINQKPEMHYRIFLEDAGVDYKPWFPLFSSSYDHFQCGPWNIPSQYHDTSWVGNNTIRWIHEHAQDGPWFCLTAFQDPHEPYVCPQPWYDKVDANQCRVYEGPREGEFDDKPAFYRQAAKGDWSAFDDGHGVPSTFHQPILDKRAAAALQATFGMIGFIDDRVGAILHALEQTGQAENTLVIFTSDHGEMHGHHGFWGKGLAPYDDSQRIPLIAWGPKLVEPIGTTDALASLIDIPKTILHYAGIQTPVGWQGVNLSPILRKEKSRVQDHTFIECRATVKIYQQTFITDRYKLVVYETLTDGELYDMDKDPDQYVNLWHLPGFASLKCELLHKMCQTQMSREGHRDKRQAFA